MIYILLTNRLAKMFSYQIMNQQWYSETCEEICNEYSHDNSYRSSNDNL